MKTIETRRLKLRMVNVHDAKDLYKTFGDEESMKWFRGEAYHSLAEVKEFLRNDTELMFSMKGAHRAYAITLKCDGSVIGYIYSQTKSYSFVHFAEVVGYVLDRDYRGNGYATEALRALMAFLFEEHDVAWVEACVSEEDGPSLRLLSRCGFHTPEWGETFDDWDPLSQTFMKDLTFTRADFSRR